MGTFPLRNVRGRHCSHVGSTSKFLTFDLYCVNLPRIVVCQRRFVFLQSYLHIPNRSLCTARVNPDNCKSLEEPLKLGNNLVRLPNAIKKNLFS